MTLAGKGIFIAQQMRDITLGEMDALWDESKKQEF